MAGIAPAAQVTAPLLGTAERPYAVLLLPAVLNDTPQKQELFLPLTLAYLLSAHVAFQFPLRPSALAVVERVFDDILRGLPKDSKGICYREIAETEGVSAFVPQSSLLLTDERGLQEMSNCNGVPLAVISKSAGNTHLLRMRNLEKIEDEGLRGKLVGCAQLINVQSEGFITEGHFSLSW
jgi:hypothetical protein